MHERGVKRSLAGLGTFFSLPERSPELNSRVADLCRHWFLPGVSHHPISLAPCYSRQPKMAGVAVTVFCRRKSLREIRRESCPFFLSAMQAICKRCTRTECARALKGGSTEARGEGKFLSRTHAITRRARASLRINEHGKKEMKTASFRVLRFYGS